MRSARRWKTREGPERQLGSSVTPGTPSGGRPFTLPLALLIMTVLPAGNQTGQTAGRLTAAQFCRKHPRKACATAPLLHPSKTSKVWISKKWPIISQGFRSVAHLSSGTGVLSEQVCRLWMSDCKNWENHYQNRLLIKPWHNTRWLKNIKWYI